MELHNIVPKYRFYLQHNELPDAHILTELAKLKLGPLEELRILERDVQALDIVLESLRRRGEVLKDLLSTYNSILAPIRRLPDDTLGEIFFHCLPATRNARPFVSESPLLLTLVCKRWRRVALATPRLWSTLHVPVVFNFCDAVSSPPDSEPQYWRDSDDMHTPAPNPRLLELQSARELGLVQWLHRSGTLPLSISLHSAHLPRFNRRHNHFEVDSEQKTLDLIARYADRISTLEAVTRHCIAAELGQAIARHFDFKKLPRLSRLRLLYTMQGSIISLMNGGHLNDTHTGMIFAPDTLRELSLQGEGIVMDIEENIMNDLGSNITVLSIHSLVGLGAAYRILSRLPQLERCHLVLAQYIRINTAAREGFNIDGTRVYLGALTTMSINGELLAIDALCQALTAPSLSNLQLDVERSALHGMAQATGSIELDSLVHLLSPTTEHISMFLSQCSSLQTLIINPTYIEAAELQSIFSSVPQLTRLIIKNCVDTRPGDVAISNSPLPSISIPKYLLHPLLRQERVSTSTGESITLEEPLLPHLTSFTWSQLSTDLTSNDLLVEFIKSRLYRPAHPNTDGLNAADNTSSKVTPLKEVTLRLALADDARAIEAEIMRHAESAGLKRGSDFNLVSVVPFTTTVPVRHTATQPPRYIIPKGYSRRSPVFTTDDGVDLEHNITWSCTDI